MSFLVQHIRMGEGMTTAEKVLEVLRQRSGMTYAAVGRELGVSRQWVHKIAETAGISANRKGRLCQACGVHLSRSAKTSYSYRNSYCLDCWRSLLAKKKAERSAACWASFVCEVCHRPFQRRACIVRMSAKAGTRIRFCSQRCHGLWLSRQKRRSLHLPNHQR